jgi:hypothetical protein
MIAEPSVALARELVSLRKGRGVNSPRLVSELGPRTRALCGVQPDDGPAAVKEKLQAAINAYLGDRPEERQALSAAYGLHPDAGRSLDERMEWLALQLGTSSRTARRRIDEAIHLFAEAAITRPVRIRTANASDPGYVVEKLDVLVRLVGPTAEVREQREIRAVDKLDEIKAAFSVPRGADTVGIVLLFGGTLAAVECPSASHVRYTVRPPSPVHEGDHFRYDVLIRMPDDRRPRSHYVVQPMTPLATCSVRVGFDPAHRPAQAWRVNGALPRLIDALATAEAVVPDPAGQVQVSWDRLREGRAYGIGWSWSEDKDTGAGSGLESH